MCSRAMPISRAFSVIAIFGELTATLVPDCRFSAMRGHTLLVWGGHLPLRLSHRTVSPRKPGVETNPVSRCQVGRLRDETPVVDVLQVFAEAFENFDFFSFGDLAFQFVQGEVNDIVVVNLLPH